MNAGRVARIATDAVCFGGWLATAPLRRRRAVALRKRPEIRSILVWNEVCGLGNMIQLSALLGNLRTLYPTARVVVMMPRSGIAPRVLTKELVDELMFVDESARSRRALLAFASTLRPRGFDLGLATFFSSTVRASAVLVSAGCRYRVAYAGTPARGFLNTITLLDGGGHEVDRHLKLLEYTGQTLDRRSRLFLSPASQGRAAEFLARRGIGVARPVLGVHPGCDRINAVKRWPVERFAAVIEQTVTAGLADVLVFLGPDEADLGAQLAAVVRDGAAIICTDQLEDASALISRCMLFLSNDSGLMHVAAALQVSVVAIFGPTDTEKNAPLGDATVLTASGVACRPCYQGPPIRCAYDRRHCLEGVSVETVMQAVRARLAPACLHAVGAQ